jgi:hypothetical protein
MEQMSFDLSQGRTQRDTGALKALVNAGDSWHERASDLALLFFKSAGYEGALFAPEPQCLGGSLSQSK